MKKEFIAYAGPKFTIEWYYDSKGKSQSHQYYENLDEIRQDKILYLFKLIANTGHIHNIEKFRNEDDQIYAFKPSPDRFLCFFVKGSNIIVTNAFEKKTDKLPQKEKSRALNYRFDYVERVKGAYIMTKKNSKNVQTTYDRHIAKMSPERKKKFDEGYRDLVLSELLLALMKEDEISVRQLAREAGLSSAIVQGIRSGTKTNITLQSFLKIMEALGCSLIVKKDQHTYPLELPQS